jgi:hypothetical protein
MSKQTRKGRAGIVQGSMDYVKQRSPDALGMVVIVIYEDTDVVCLSTHRPELTKDLLQHQIDALEEDDDTAKR